MILICFKGTFDLIRKAGESKALQSLFGKKEKKEKQLGYYVFLASKNNQFFIFFLRKTTKAKGRKIIADKCKQEQYKLESIFFEDTISERDMVLQDLHSIYKQPVNN